MATRVDLNGLLTNLKTIFDAANTTTASADLSANMTTRVKTVAKINPNVLRPEADLFPLVTCYVTGKEMAETSIGRSQANTKRKALVTIDVVGGIWNDSFNTATDDPAAQDIHYLMENVELILRSNEVLSGAALWSVAEQVTYFDFPMSEESHLRSGILTLKASVYY